MVGWSAGRRFWIGKVNGKKVISVRCGIGMVTLPTSLVNLFGQFVYKNIYFGILHMHACLFLGSTTLFKWVESEVYTCSKHIWTGMLSIIFILFNLTTKTIHWLYYIYQMNAAATTQQMIDLFDIKGIIHYGIAGNLNNSMNIGDVTIPKQLADTSIWDWLVHSTLAYILLSDFFEYYISLMIIENDRTPLQNWLHHIWQSWTLTPTMFQIPTTLIY